MHQNESVPCMTSLPETLEGWRVTKMLSMENLTEVSRDSSRSVRRNMYEACFPLNLL